MYLAVFVRNFALFIHFVVIFMRNFEETGDFVNHSNNIHFLAIALGWL
jgi:hypothetical protein